MRRTFVFSLTLLVLLSTASVSYAARKPYPPGVAVSCERARVQPGGAERCAMAGFAPRSEVTVVVAGPGFSLTYVVFSNSRGVAEVNIRVPVNAPDTGIVVIDFIGTGSDGQQVRGRSQFQLEPVVLSGGGAPSTTGGEESATTTTGTIATGEDAVATTGAPESAPAPAEALPLTGWMVSRAAALAFGLLMVGLLLILVARRRRASGFGGSDAIAEGGR